MKTQTQAVSTDATAAFEPNSSWLLHEQPRFPVDAWGWDETASLPSCPRIKILGEHGYDLVVNRRARRAVCNTVRRLISAFPQDFEAASKLFNGVQWRTLFYVELYPIATLGDPSFDPHRAFQKLYELHESLVDIPPEWTGSTGSTSEVLAELRPTIADARCDDLKAAWSILGFARSLGLEKHEVLVLPWWEPWWINRCLVASV